MIRRASQMARRHEASERQRQEQQGLGRSIISTEFREHRFVAVGGQMRWGKWKTFEDFLFDYLKSVFGREWAEAELKKPVDDRHPLFGWLDEIARSRAGRGGGADVVHFDPWNPALAQFLGLAYNLYLLAHNAELQDFLVRRLKHVDQFRGAVYETYVAAWSILSGLEIELEVESDPTRKHCEFTATSKASGRKYSVEAKVRAPGKDHVGINRQLHAALKKTADHERIVFIEVAVDPAKFPPQDAAERMSAELRRMEGDLECHGEPAPPAYAVITNQPFRFDEVGRTIGRFGMVEGFKLPDWGGGTESVGVLEAFKNRQRHRDVINLGEAFHRYSIPSTFDGEAPDLAFADAPARLLVGNRIGIEHSDGSETAGEIVTGCVIESQSTATIALRKDDGQTSIVDVPLTEEEMAAYRQHPRTFFGEVSGNAGKLNGPVDFFEWMHGVYSKTARERLLEFMRDAPDIERLRAMSREDLALVYCERIVNVVMAEGRVPTG